MGKIANMDDLVREIKNTHSDLDAFDRYTSSHLAELQENKDRHNLLKLAIESENLKLVSYILANTKLRRLYAYTIKGSSIKLIESLKNEKLLQVIMLHPWTQYIYEDAYVYTVHRHKAEELQNKLYKEFFTSIAGEEISEGRSTIWNCFAVRPGIISFEKKRENEEDDERYNVLQSISWYHYSRPRDYVPHIYGGESADSRPAYLSAALAHSDVFSKIYISKPPLMRRYYLDPIDVLEDRNTLYEILSDGVTEYDVPAIAQDNVQVIKNILGKYENDPLLLNKFDDNTNPLYNVISPDDNKTLESDYELDAGRVELIKYILSKPRLKNAYLYDDNNLRHKSAFYWAHANSKILELIMGTGVNSDINKYEKDAGTHIIHSCDRQLYQDYSSEVYDLLEDAKRRYEQMEDFSFSELNKMIVNDLNNEDAKSIERLFKEKNSINPIKKIIDLRYNYDQLKIILKAVVGNEILREKCFYAKNAKNPKSGLYLLVEKACQYASANSDSAEALELLLECPGIDFTIRTNQTPLGSLYDYALYHQIEYIAKAIEVYVARAAKFNQPKPFPNNDIISDRYKIHQIDRNSDIYNRQKLKSEEINSILDKYKSAPHLLVDFFSGKNPLHIAIENNLTDVVKHILSTPELRDFYCYDALSNDGSALYYLIDIILTKGYSPELPELKLLAIFLQYNCIDFKKPGQGFYGSAYDLVQKGYARQLEDKITEYLAKTYQGASESSKIEDQAQTKPTIKVESVDKILTIEQLISAIKNNRNAEMVRNYLDVNFAVIQFLKNPSDNPLNPYLIAKEAQNTEIMSFIENRADMHKVWNDPSEDLKYFWIAESTQQITVIYFDNLNDNCQIYLLGNANDMNFEDIKDAVIDKGDFVKLSFSQSVFKGVVEGLISRDLLPGDVSLSRDDLINSLPEGFEENKKIEIKKRNIKEVGWRVYVVRSHDSKHVDHILSEENETYKANQSIKRDRFFHKQVPVDETGQCRICFEEYDNRERLRFELVPKNKKITSGKREQSPFYICSQCCTNPKILTGNHPQNGDKILENYTIMFCPVETKGSTLAVSI